MSADEDKSVIENILSKYGPSFVYVLIIAVLIDHLLGLGHITEIQWQDVVLIGGLLLIPFFREIDQIFIPNVGGFQMNQTKNWKETMEEVLNENDYNAYPSEDDSQTDYQSPKPDESGGASSEDDELGEEGIEEENRETERTSRDDADTERESEEDINKYRSEKRVQTLGGDVEEIAEELYSLADDDPRLAISKLGMELEHGLRHMLFSKGVEPSYSYSKMLDQLNNDPEIDSRFVGVANEIRFARNEAVHSAEFDMRNTAGLIDVGIDLLKYINRSTVTNKIPETEPRTSGK